MSGIAIENNNVVESMSAYLQANAKSLDSIVFGAQHGWSSRTYSKRNAADAAFALLGNVRMAYHTVFFNAGEEAIWQHPFNEAKQRAFEAIHYAERVTERKISTARF